MKMSKELKIGSFAVMVFVLSFFVINFLRGEDIFNREIELTASYDNVEGLVPSAPVYIKGYKAGKVVEVEYDKEQQIFDVVCSIKKEFMIPADSRMTIYSVDIMGGKGVKIDLGSSAEYVEDGDRLEPAFEAGLMDGLSAGIGPLIDKVGNTLDSLSVTVAGINSILNDANRSRISSTLKHLDATMADVRAIASEVNGKSDELNLFIDNLAALSEKLAPVMEQVDSTMTSVTSVVNKIDRSDIEGVIESFNSLLKKIDDPEGTVGKLLVYGSVYNSLDSLLSDIDSLVRKIEENPKKYIRISVF